jgi:SWI/SNF-related matrix-associated actin-dependent regulator of chromatin subfamily A-like protein 1
LTIKKKCPICNKIAEIKSESKIAGMQIINYACGHVRTRKIPQPKDLEVTSTDNKKPFKYQLEGAAWGVRGNARVLFADEMGVGKTLQSFLICKSDPQEYLPILIICKPGLKAQMIQEAYRWCGWLLQDIESEKDFILPGVNGYVVSYDTLTYSNFVGKSGKVIKRGIEFPAEWVKKINPRTIILDECQQIKNPESKRTRAVQSIARDIDHLIPLSGTPIFNNAGEYFVILNMLYPEKFPTKASYVARWCDTYFTGYTQKIGGIKDPKEFKEYTSDFIIRRTREEVLPDLPKVDRRFRFEELGEKVEAAYKEEFKKFQDYYYYGNNGDSSFQRDGNILAYLSKMRHLAGIAKIPGVVEFVEEFIQETDRKIVIFTHHHDVSNEIVSRLSQTIPNVLKLGVPIDQSVVDKFWKSEYRVLQASTIAGGEGINLQCCSDCIIIEPEWNPGKEDQAEGRFPRPGQTADKITSTSFIAVGTVDEFFSQIKEQKRSYFSSTIEGKEVVWSESSLIKELAEVLAAKGGKKWGW